MQRARGMAGLAWAAVMACLVSSSLARADAAAPRKIALLVGLSHYDHNRGKPPDWWNLTSDNDIAAIKAVLLSPRFGFPEKDILVLADEQASRQGIIDAFQHHLIDQARPGDIVYFHYSGHGQILLEAEDNVQPDGLEDSLVPYDYKSQSARDGYHTNLRAATLQQLLDKLRARMVGLDGKCHGSILVTIDSCFSGNATRAADDLVSRGRGWDPALDGERPPLSRGGPSAARDDGGGLLGRDEAKRKGYVVLSACRADQTAKEIKGMGAFTCELVQAMPRATSYRDLFEAVSASVRSEIRGQDPQGEGDLDQVLFGDQILPPRQYYLAQVTPEGKLELPVGEVQGATVGSVFAMYRPQGDVSDEKQCIGQARVRAVGETTSELEPIGNLAGGATKAALNGARAVEVAHSFGADALRLLLRTKSKRAADLGRLDVVVTAGVTDKDYDVRLDDDPRTPGKLLLATRDGRPLASVADDDRAAEAIRTELVAEWRWRFLCRLRNGATRKTVRIAVRVVPVAVETNEAGLVTKVLGDRKDRPPTSGGDTILYAGDYVAVELRNQSEHPVWATVLDLTADGSVGPVYPHPEMPGLFKPVPADGEWYRLPYPFVFQLGDHLGREIFRVIATPERADFSPLLCERAATGRGVGDADALRGIPPEVNPLGRLLLFAATGARGDPADVPMGTWDTAQATFEVREATK